MASPDDGDRRRRIPDELSPLTLFLASLGSVAATVLVSRFGLAGTIAGAALTPVVIAVVRELARRPVEKVVRLPSGTVRVPVPETTFLDRLRRVRPRTVVITAAAAFAIAVAVFTVPDLIRGESVVSDRPATFFGRDGRDRGGDRDPAPATTTTTTTTTQTVTAPPATTPTAPTTTAPPAATDPATPVAPDPSAAPPVVPVPATPQPEAPAPTTTSPVPPPGG